MSSSRSWNEQISHLPGAHVLQSSQWGEVKNRFGWQAAHYLWIRAGEQTTPRMTALHDLAADTVSQVDAAAMILTRAIHFLGLSIKVMYVPKGPLLDWQHADLRRQVLSDLAGLARRQRALFIKIDPDIPLGAGWPGLPASRADESGQAILSELAKTGWRESEEQIQFRNTVLLDLRLSEAELLANMKPKTRYNLRLAERKGVLIRLGTPADLPLLYQMYAETSLRDGFVIRSEEYYHAVWLTFLQAGLAEILIAEADNEPVAALILFSFSQTAWYLYGMSRQAQREKMPNYLLQWRAIQRAKERGCQVYDLWGAPDRLDETDPMWGVYRFKEGLGGQLVRHIGAWDLPVQPRGYWLYTQALPKILNFMRRRGKEQTRQQLGA
ncbi:MAG: peptidoglycan bridge formation glycyltransferase FemA/FemB family protein [Anaerolineales bacterium]|jgi:lipid II:glycine glycyltransferase (peptidoglycan interpeptide bridge formation enzyme)|nr:peptidoglycan bridge formation glycyltransferase FemA/FemB family protein [Anaerolineales bacterium]